MGMFIYYRQSIDGTMLPALNNIGTAYVSPRVKIQQKIHRLMDYATTYPNVYIIFYASDMVLNIDTYISLVLPNTKSRIVEYYYFKTSNDIINAQIHAECKTLKHVVWSAAEAEAGDIFANAQFQIVKKSKEIIFVPNWYRVCLLSVYHLHVKTKK